MCSKKTLMGFGFKKLQETPKAKNGGEEGSQSAVGTQDRVSAVKLGVKVEKNAPFQKTAVFPSGYFEAGRCSVNCNICNLSSSLGPGWYEVFEKEFEKDYMRIIIYYLHVESVFYPPADKIFEFTRFFEPKGAKVVIIGQDPYHGEGQATGLAFSVPVGQRIPPSLQNIFKEIKNNYHSFLMPKHGNLEIWAKQGVLLMNDCLTVKKGMPNSHSCLGWQYFTHNVISFLNANCSHVVFMLWGASAAKLHLMIDKEQHLILKSPHPSPYSAERGFFGSRHFIRANAYLVRHGMRPINWNL